TDSTSTPGSAEGSGGQPVVWEAPTAPAMSPLETLDGATPLDVLPPAPPSAPRSKRPWIVGIAVAAVLVLVMGGVAAAPLPNRPHDKLQRALSATPDRPTGSMTMSITGEPSDDATAQMLFDKGAVRVAWDKGSDTQQYVVLMDGAQVLDLVVAPDSVIVQQDLAASGYPEATDALDSLTQLAAMMGPDGQALVDFAKGSPLKIATGPDSAFGKLMAQADALGGGSPKPDDAKVQALADKIQQSIRDNVTVTDEGSDQYGDHLKAVVPLKAVLTDVIPELEAIAGESFPKSDLDKITGDPQVTLDFWVRDGAISRVEVPIGHIANQLAPDEKTPDVTIVVQMSDQGVVPPTGDVVTLPDSLFDGLGSGLLGGGMGGVDSGFGLDDSGL
ncbi:MAG: hypothetical protein AB7V23_03925, partial [Candidatus Nanopelagicales bacterium]